MCGEFDEDDRAERALYERFRVHARRLLKAHPAPRPAEQNGLAPYLDTLFSDALNRCLRDGEGMEEGRRYDMLAAQPLAFARLAGFLAAHASLREDPLRKVIEAVMHGYAEAERFEPDHDHEHGDAGHHHHHADHHH
jgi:hypothetical protein